MMLYLRIVLAMLFCAITFPAMADTDYACQDSPTSSLACTQSQAMAAANSYAQGVADRANVGTTAWVPCARDNGDQSISAFAAQPSCSNATNFTGSRAFYYSQAKTCATAQPLTNVSFAGAPSAVCSGGCKYAPDLGGGALYRTVGSGSTMRTFADSMTPTGDTCTTATDLKESKPDQSACYSTGAAYTECVKPNGQHCVTGARGSTLCWQPGEVGPRMTVDGSYSGDREKAPTAPKPPSEQKDSTVIESSQTTINGDTYNTSTYSGSGNSGGQPNTGGGKDNGSGGEGSGNGGDGDGEGSGPGGAGAGVGKLYTPTDKTVGSLISAYYKNITNTPMLASISHFMMISGGGSCPVFTVSATQWTPALVLDQHCSGAFYAALQACGWVLLGIVSYLAIRIAVT